MLRRVQTDSGEYVDIVKQRQATEKVREEKEIYKAAAEIMESLIKKKE